MHSISWILFLVKHANKWNKWHNWLDQHGMPQVWGNFSNRSHYLMDNWVQQGGTLPVLWMRSNVARITSNHHEFRWLCYSFGFPIRYSCYVIILCIPFCILSDPRYWACHQFLYNLQYVLFRFMYYSVTKYQFQES